jgi:hypothetical protein
MTNSNIAKILVAGLVAEAPVMLTSYADSTP